MKESTFTRDGKLLNSGLADRQQFGQVAPLDFLEAILSLTHHVPVANATKDLVATLFLKRFTIQADLVENNVCGTGTPGEFQATLSVTALGLDGQGFVIDNRILLREIRQQFGEGELKASCEELAGGLINVAAQLIGPSRLMNAKARVFNETGYVDVEWSANMGFPPPPFPRQATYEEVESRWRNPRPPTSC